MNNLPTRKPNRLRSYDYAQNGAYFVTMCTKNREKLFGRIIPAVGATAPGRPCVNANNIPHTKIPDRPYYIKANNNPPLNTPNHPYINKQNNPHKTTPNRPYMSLTALGKCVDETIKTAGNNINNGVKIDKYVIMPNHVHLIIVICSMEDFVMDDSGWLYLDERVGVDVNGRGRLCTDDRECVIGNDAGRLYTDDRGRVIGNGTGRSHTDDRECVIGNYTGRSHTDDRGRSSLRGVVRNIKSYVTKWAGFPVWQKSFHDHIIRNHDDYCRITKYIDNNMKKWIEEAVFLNRSGGI